MFRNHTKEIQIGNRVIGGGNPILIQSMTNTKTEDVAATVAQILALEEAGCEIIRCAVPTMQAAAAIKEIKKQIHIPLVADIHFDYRDRKSTRLNSSHVSISYAVFCLKKKNKNKKKKHMKQITRL